MIHGWWPPSVSPCIGALEPPGAAIVLAGAPGMGSSGGMIHGCCDTCCRRGAPGRAARWRRGSIPWAGKCAMELCIRPGPPLMPSEPPKAPPPLAAGAQLLLPPAKKAPGRPVLALAPAASRSPPGAAGWGRAPGAWTTGGQPGARPTCADGGAPSGGLGSDGRLGAGAARVAGCPTRCASTSAWTR